MQQSPRPFVLGLTKTGPYGLNKLASPEEEKQSMHQLSDSSTSKSGSKKVGVPFGRNTEHSFPIRSAYTGVSVRLNMVD